MAPRPSQQLPFDQHDKKYWCACGQLHITVGAKVIAVLASFTPFVELVFAFASSATAALYSLFSLGFAVVVYGTLLYGAFKQKKHYLVPYLIVQGLTLVLLILGLVLFVFGVGFNSTWVLQLGRDFWSIDTNAAKSEIDSEMRSFVIGTILGVFAAGAVQGYFFDVIFSFYNFLKDRETSFNFGAEIATASYHANGAFGAASTSSENGFPHSATNTAENDDDFFKTDHLDFH